MSVADSDVSWTTLRRIVRRWAGPEAELEEVAHLHGGAVSATMRLTLRDGKKAVAKVAVHRVDRSLEREAKQLELLRGIGIPTPQVYDFRLANLDEPDSYLLMEFCDGVDLAVAKESCSADEYEHLQRQLAEMVLRMHGETSGAYYRACTAEEHKQSWPEFFAAVYAPMWEELEKDPHTSKTTKRNFLKVHDALPVLLAHDDKPRLVHWDLWTGNVLASRNGEGWKIRAILDPVCKYAHAEAELAYLELFHTVTPEFMRTYRERRKLPEEYSKIRREVYQLYHWLDHAAFFGGTYHAKFADAAEKAARLA
jgi:fructosamine-3-kinase